MYIRMKFVLMAFGLLTAFAAPAVADTLATYAEYSAVEKALEIEAMSAAYDVWLEDDQLQEIDVCMNDQVANEPPTRDLFDALDDCFSKVLGEN